MLQFRRRFSIICALLAPALLAPALLVPTLTRGQDVVLRNPRATTRFGDTASVRNVADAKSGASAMRVTLHYLYAPVELTVGPGGAQVGMLVEHAVHYEWVGAYALADGVDLRLTLHGPLAQTQDEPSERNFASIDSAGFGDPALSTLLRIWSGWGWSLGTAVDMTLPFGSSGALSSWDAVTLGLSAQMAYARGPWLVVLEAGPHWRPQRALLDFRTGTDYELAFAAGYRPSSSYQIGIEFVAATGLEAGRIFSRANTLVQPRLFAFFGLAPWLELGAQVGAGLGDGVGNATFECGLGLRAAWQQESK